MKIDYSAEFSVDRKAFRTGSLFEESDEKLFWQHKSPIERLRAIELIRQIVYGYTDSSQRLQRVFEAVELKTS